ncbi:heptosyltransferase, partial [Burkholderia thailandensis]|nr:heptosyltransferase [Burkholderia thailandensis]
MDAPFRDRPCVRIVAGAGRAVQRGHAGGWLGDARRNEAHAYGPVWAGVPSEIEHVVEIGANAAQRNLEERLGLADL